MAVYKNRASQKLAVFAVDATGAPKTGDAANISAQISLDGAATNATNDAAPTELDATDAPGVYLFDMTQAETNADLMIVAPKSSTSGVVLRPVIIYTEPELRSLAADQAVNVTKINGTAQTAGDLAARIPAALVGGRMDASVGAQAVNADSAGVTEILTRVPDATAGASGGLAIVGSVMGKSAATLAAADVSGNLPADVKAQTVNADSAGVTALTATVGAAGAGLTAIPAIATVTNLTNLPAAAATAAELLKVPKSDSNVSWNATALAAINEAVDTALNTAIPGSPTADSINERVVAIDAYGAPPSVATMVATVAKVEAMLVADGGVSQFTANALELAPTGAGGGLDAAGVRAAVGLGAANLDTQVAAVKGDTGTTLGRVIGTIGAGTHSPQTGDAFGRLGAAGAGLTALGDTRMANLDAAVSSRTKPADTQAAVTTAGTVTDKAGYALSGAGVTAVQTGLSTLTAQQVWEYATRTVTSLGTVVADVATAVWAAAARTLTAFGFSVPVSDKTGFSLATPPPAASEVADAVWDEAAAGHTTSGTTGKALSTAGSGGVDPELVADAIFGTVTTTLTDGNTIGGLIAAKLPTLGSGTIINTYPLSADGATLTIKIGDSYLVADGRSLAWASDSWVNDLMASPAPTAIRLVANTRPALSVLATATAARAVRVELTHLQTAALRAGTFKFDIEAAWADGRVETLVSQGVIVTVADVAV